MAERNYPCDSLIDAYFGTQTSGYFNRTGEAIFGEVGARAPGGRLSHGMNYACDGDVFRLWAEAITRGTSEQSMDRRFNAALVFKRAHGDGQLVTRIEGLEPILARDGEHLPVVELVPIGAHAN